MDVLEKILLVLHLLGFGALFGALLAQVRDTVRRVTPGMMHGIGTSLVSGILLVGVLEGGTDPVDHTKIAVKFAVAAVIAVLLWVNRRKESVPAGLYFGLLGLTTANVLVAVLW